MSSSPEKKRGKHFPGSSSSSTSSSVHHKLSLLTGSSSSSSKPFIKSKSQTTSSIVFPSFRFSPESEEIQEITNIPTASATEHNLSDRDADENIRRASFGGTTASEKIEDRSTTPPLVSQQEASSSSSALPSASSSKSSGGDVSPLKEYLLKHKWGKNWEKRSLSLDLDLKGKIITAIEDKRRSFVSHFYNEEEEEILRSDVHATSTPPSLITSSCSIPDQLVSSTSGFIELDSEDLSIHSDSAIIQQPSSSSHGNVSKRKFFHVNMFEEANSDYYDDFEVSHSSSLPNTPITSLLPDDLKHLIVEEIGVDCCEDTSMVGEDGNVNISLLREFLLPPEAVQESFQGLPTLYNPPSVVRNLRKFPLQEVISVKERDDPDGEGRDRTGSAASIESGESIYYPAPSPADSSFASVIKGLAHEVVYHPFVKYWIAVLACVVLFDFGAFIDKMIWFGLGAMLIIIVNQVLWKEEPESRDHTRGGSEEDVVSGASSASSNSFINENRLAGGVYWKSQGWMLTFPPMETSIPYPLYDAFTYHLRNTKPVFVRLDGSYLLVSHPHPKHRIPKRRLWNDPVFNTDMIFIKHSHYNLYGAKVEIVPIGLSKKRVWCKKYPIAITLACRDRYIGKLLESGSNGDRSPGEKSGGVGAGGGTGVGGGGGEDTVGSVSFSKDDKGNSSVRVGKDEVLKGEIYKEDNVAGKTLYLFARTDREKDDWFRRLMYASKHHKVHGVQSSPGGGASPDFSSFISYMKRACPLLQVQKNNVSVLIPKGASPRSATPTNSAYETVLIPNNNTNSSSNSPSVSRKSTPDKDHVLGIAAAGDLYSPAFLNALIARMFYDFLRSPKWKHEIKNMIDRKLFFLRKPKIVQSLKVKELDLGDALPVINHASLPTLDRQGLWVDLDLSYTGTIVITIEAFVNLLNMGKSSDGDMKPEPPAHPHRSPSKSPTSRPHAMFDSDADDSGESSESEDEIDLEEDASDSKSKERETDSRGKMFKYADAIAKSSVMRNKHVQKVVTNIASTPFVLTVEIKKVVGSVAVNIPPLPNDRVWIGFRSNPDIDINARPKVGERVVSLSQITGWIKRKILLEFQRVMVCPNMMDVTVPLMEFELPK